MKYINADKLIDVIDNSIAYCQINYSDDYALGFEQSLREVKNFINWQPEVDLKIEIGHWLDKLDNRYGALVEYYSIQDIKDTARHFYELGLNARKV